MSIHDSPFARKLSAFVALTEEDLNFVSEIYKRRRKFAAKSDMAYEGQADQSAYILASGWVCSYKGMPDGGRQIVDIQIPGDFLGLRSLLFRTSDHSFEPVTRIEASEIKTQGLLTLFENSPRLAIAVLWAASRDEAMVVEHLVNIGRRSALERTAHFLLELGARLRLVGLATRKGYDCPLSQYVLADALGLSAIHVNRVLRQMREAGLLTFQKGHVTFDNLEGLIAMCGFNAGYLDHDGPLLA